MNKIIGCIIVLVLLCSCSIPEIGSKNQENYIYSIENMTAEAVLNECIIIFENETNSKQTIEDYYSTFHTPASIEENEGMTILKYYSIDDLAEYDAVKSVTFTTPHTKLDGHIDLDRRNAMDYCRIRLVVFDYDKATNIYELLFGYLDSHYSDVEEEKKETWLAKGRLEGDDSFVTGFDDSITFLSISREENYYIIDAYDYLGYTRVKRYNYSEN